LKDNGIADDALLEEMNKKIMDTVNEATDYAENAAYASPEHALRFVYAEGEDA
ncbi:MAG: thiamine pyrophosphate-dependent dehydrogenase E1 component subunit alpha, partial [Priestia megaterium]